MGRVEQEEGGMAGSTDVWCGGGDGTIVTDDVRNHVNNTEDDGDELTGIRILCEEKRRTSQTWLEKVKM